MEGVLAGHNILITGQAGTGKSTLLKKIHAKLCSSGISCQLTAMTGLAAVSIDGMTIHRFTGMHDIIYYYFYMFFPL